LKSLLNCKEPVETPRPGGQEAMALLKGAPETVEALLLVVPPGYAATHKRLVRGGGYLTIWRAT
jgi:hypothetical protein